jgi:hypothetical protein
MMKKLCRCDIAMKGCFYLVILIGSCLIGTGCATTYIKATSTTNPPPKHAFSEYDKFEVEPIVISEEYRDHGANIRAAAKIQANLDNTLKPLLISWNKDAQNQECKSLIVKPKIESIKFIGGGARFWAGPMAGSSAVHMRVTIADQDTGEIIASPEFYQHGNAWAGGMSIGATDNAMLNRISDLVLRYMLDNYKTPVGGQTGAVR